MTIFRDKRLSLISWICLWKWWSRVGFWWETNICYRSNLIPSSPQTRNSVRLFYRANMSDGGNASFVRVLHDASLFVVTGKIPSSIGRREPKLRPRYLDYRHFLQAFQHTAYCKYCAVFPFPADAGASGTLVRSESLSGPIIGIRSTSKQTLSLPHFQPWLPF